MAFVERGEFCAQRSCNVFPIERVIGTKFLSEQVVKGFKNTGERQQNVPIKICPYQEIMCGQRFEIRKKFL